MGLFRNKKKNLVRVPHELIVDLDEETFKKLCTRNITKGLKYPIYLNFSDAKFMLTNIDAIKIIKGGVFKELTLDNNHLTEIRGFEIFSKLKRLSAVHNEIRRVEIPSLQNLVLLDLSENQLTVFPDVSGCSNLQRLILRNNTIYDWQPSFPSISKCSKLQSMDLSWNNLDWNSEQLMQQILPILSKMKKLVDVSFQNNPFSSNMVNYRNLFIQMLPQIRFLDNIDVSRKERKRIENNPDQGPVFAQEVKHLMVNTSATTMKKIPSFSHLWRQIGVNAQVIIPSFEDLHRILDDTSAGYTLIAAQKLAQNLETCIREGKKIMMNGYVRFLHTLRQYASQDGENSKLYILSILYSCIFLTDDNTNYQTCYEESVTVVVSLVQEFGKSVMDMFKEILTPVTTYQVSNLSISSIHLIHLLKDLYLELLRLQQHVSQQQEHSILIGFVQYLYNGLFVKCLRTSKSIKWSQNDMDALYLTLFVDAAECYLSQSSHLSFIQEEMKQIKTMHTLLEWFQHTCQDISSEKYHLICQLLLVLAPVLSQEFEELNGHALAWQVLSSQPLSTDNLLKEKGIGLTRLMVVSYTVTTVPQEWIDKFQVWKQQCISLLSQPSNKTVTSIVQLYYLIHCFVFDKSLVKLSPQECQEMQRSIQKEWLHMETYSQVNALCPEYGNLVYMDWLNWIPNLTSSVLFGLLLPHANQQHSIIMNRFVHRFQTQVLQRFLQTHSISSLSSDDAIYKQVIEQLLAIPTSTGQQMHSLEILLRVFLHYEKRQHDSWLPSQQKEKLVMQILSVMSWITSQESRLRKYHNTLSPYLLPCLSSFTTSSLSLISYQDLYISIMKQMELLEESSSIPLNHFYLESNTELAKHTKLVMSTLRVLHLEFPIFGRHLIALSELLEISNQQQRLQNLQEFLDMDGMGLLESLIDLVNKKYQKTVKKKTANRTSFVNQTNTNGNGNVKLPLQIRSFGTKGEETLWNQNHKKEFALKQDSVLEKKRKSKNKEELQKEPSLTSDFYQTIKNLISTELQQKDSPLSKVLMDSSSEAVMTLVNELTAVKTNTAQDNHHSNSDDSWDTNLTLSEDDKEGDEEEDQDDQSDVLSEISNLEEEDLPSASSSSKSNRVSARFKPLIARVHRKTTLHSNTASANSLITAPISPASSSVPLNDIAATPVTESMWSYYENLDTTFSAQDFYAFVMDQQSKSTTANSASLVSNRSDINTNTSIGMSVMRILCNLLHRSNEAIRNKVMEKQRINAAQLFTMMLRIGQSKQFSSYRMNLLILICLQSVLKSHVFSTSNKTSIGSKIQAIELASLLLQQMNSQVLKNVKLQQSLTAMELMLSVQLIRSWHLLVTQLHTLEFFTLEDCKKLMGAQTTTVTTQQWMTLNQICCTKLQTVVLPLVDLAILIRLFHHHSCNQSVNVHYFDNKNLQAAWEHCFEQQSIHDTLSTEMEQHFSLSMLQRYLMTYTPAYTQHFVHMNESKLDFVQLITPSNELNLKMEDLVSEFIRMDVRNMYHILDFMLRVESSDQLQWRPSLVQDILNLVNSLGLKEQVTKAFSMNQVLSSSVEHAMAFGHVNLLNAADRSLKRRLILASETHLYIMREEQNKICLLMKLPYSEIGHVALLMGGKRLLITTTTGIKFMVLEFIKEFVADRVMNLILRSGNYKLGNANETLTDMLCYALQMHCKLHCAQVTLRLNKSKIRHYIEEELFYELNGVMVAVGSSTSSVQSRHNFQLFSEKDKAESLQTVLKEEKICYFGSATRIVQNRYVPVMMCITSKRIYCFKEDRDQWIHFYDWLLKTFTSIYNNNNSNALDIFAEKVQQPEHIPAVLTLFSCRLLSDVSQVEYNHNGDPMRLKISFQNSPTYDMILPSDASIIFVDSLLKK